MKTTIVISRFILDLGFVVFWLNILHPFLPQPPIPDGSLPARFMGVMGPSHWMALVGLFQVFGGVFVLLGHPTGLEGGYYVKPTVFVNVKNEMAIAEEEIFGP